MKHLQEPIIGRFYTYDHSDYTNLALCYRRIGGFYYFIEHDDGGDPSALWFNYVDLAYFNKKFKPVQYDKDDWQCNAFFDAYEGFKQGNYYTSDLHWQPSDEDFELIEDAVAIVRVANHITDQYGNSKTNYQEYLKTQRWKQIKAIKLSYNNKCQLCGSKDNLQVHHSTYEHVGDEKNHLEDLIVLCKDCHAKFHDKMKNYE